MTPTEKAINMAERIEQLEKYNQELMEVRYALIKQHEHEMQVQEAYVAGIKATLEALLNRSVKI